MSIVKIIPQFRELFLYIRISFVFSIFSIVCADGMSDIQQFTSVPTRTKKTTKKKTWLPLLQTGGEKHVVKHFYKKQNILPILTFNNPIVLSFSTISCLIKTFMKPLIFGIFSTFSKAKGKKTVLRANGFQKAVGHIFFFFFLHCLPKLPS